MGTSTVVPTDLSAADLLRHYGRQLEAEGWQVPGRPGASPVLSGTWSRADSTGVAQLTLEVSEAAPASGCYQVEMKVIR